ncbi:MAG: GGDEF domain-containing protein [Pseudomonadota bacterium]|nr:GGDEF domain-containing protein [Pseudomonadota bacterium]
MIDIRTFMLVLGIGNIGFAMLMAGYARSAADNPALRVWAWAKLVQGCAHLLGWLRPDLPWIGVTIAANTTLILGSAVEVAAYCTFFGFPRWRRVLYPCAALALLVFHGARVAHTSANGLVVLMSLVIASCSGAMAFILLRAGPDHSLLRRVIGYNDLAFCVVMSLRAYNGIADGGLTVFAPSLVQSASYLTGYLLMIVNGFGFLLLCKEKDDQQLARLATTDSLTGLVNRRAFFDRTDSARLLATRLRSPIALMMIDIDHFKRLNDHYGHATGDEALCLFADTARQALRDHDIMGRLGGEEFALVLPCTDLEGALQAAERLRHAVAAAPLPAGGHQYGMTISIGVVVIDPNEHINSALARADHALYAAKSGGRDRVESGEPRLRVVGGRDSMPA